MRLRSLWVGAVLLGAAALAGCGARSQPPGEASGTVKQENGQTVREYTLVAKKVQHEIKPKVKVEAWTFNGSVPGPLIRVQQGERLRVTLKNELPEPVSIHWHGMRVPNDMDGVPGVTQNAVQPGQSYTYEFVIRDPGTYWYHSHQRSAEQVDKGLYGAIVVEPKEQAARPDRDYTLILDEWATGGMMSSMGSGMMSGGGHGAGHGGGGQSGGMAMSPAQGGHDMNAMYDVFVINGKAAPAVPALEVKQGERVRLRLVGAGYQTHLIHLHGHTFQVVATDGQPIAGAAPLKDVLVPVAPGERYDLEFVADNPGRWYLESHDTGQQAADMRVEIRYAGTTGTAEDKTPAGGQLPVLDLTKYGNPGQVVFTQDTRFDVTYTMELGSRTTGMETVYTINGKTYPETEPIRVKKGDKVKVRLINKSDVEHPMHLHGHFFQVLSRNGQPVTGAPIWKDTLNVRPGEEYEIAFVAEDPGNWMFHCHELHHAASGMVTEVKYDGFVPGFTPDPKAGNRPE